MKKILDSSFVRYLFVGVFNTLFGFGIIFILMYYGVLAEIANLIGYFFGILLSYLLNKYFTFRSKNSHKKEFYKFIIAMGIAYLINLCALSISYRILHIDKYLSQIIAGICYTISGYLLNRFFTFK